LSISKYRISQAVFDELLTIDHSDLRKSLSEALINYGYYSHRAALAWYVFRQQRVSLERQFGIVFNNTKEDEMENGKSPSDKFAEAEANVDFSVIKEKKRLNVIKRDAERLSALVRGLEYKMDLVRSLLASERQDKSQY
jgi:hypothetical protein